MTQDAPGLNFVYDDGVGASNDYVYAADLAGENIIGGDFLDIIDFGAGYVFTTVAADANVVKTRLVMRTSLRSFFSKIQMKMVFLRLSLYGLR